ncbi:response regulator transcription factor [Gracilibacillus timonensis]|uniref:response regulator transcription factor n=1 Tax=Gracilibacillus timonensis TaxID=1816696 RepID=UPI000826EF84|nr:response regulator transcription factor [Gracilibacillus timonensis]
MVNVLIVDDHQLVGEGTKSMLEANEEFSVTYTATAEEALSLQASFDLYILDLYLAGMTGLTLAQKLLQHDPQRKVVLCTGFPKQHTPESLAKMGIRGVVSKEAPKSEFMPFIHLIVAGYTIFPFSAKQHVTSNVYGLIEEELLVLEKVSQGYKNKIIAEDLFVSDRTIEHRLTSIFKKLAVKNRMEAVQVAAREGLVGNPENFKEE